MDVRDGFWYIPTHQAYKKNTTVSSLQRAYLNSNVSRSESAANQQLSCVLWTRIKWKHFFTYLDDIFCMEPTCLISLRLEKVLEATRTADFKLNPEKCVYAIRSLNYLGQEIEGIDIIIRIICRLSTHSFSPRAYPDASYISLLE